MAERLYKFDWRFVGDLERGRPTLGNTMRIELYRLFQYTLRDVLEQRIGTEQCDLVMYKAGYVAGIEFCKKFLYVSLGLGEFLRQLVDVLREYGVGLLEVVEVGEDESGKPRMELVVREDLDCSGLENMGHAVCSYDEGFISGILKSYMGADFEVHEIKCWCLGDECCRFEARLK